MIIPIAIPTYVTQPVPDSGNITCVGAGVGVDDAINVGVGVGAGVVPGGVIVGVGVGVDVVQIQSESSVQEGLRQFPTVAFVAMLQTRPDGHSELDVQLLLHWGTGLGLADGLGVGLFVGVGVGVCEPAGEGEGEGEGEGVLTDKVNERLHARVV